MQRKFTKTLLIVAVFFTSSAKSDYLDVGYNNQQFTMSAKYYAKGFVFNAERSERDKVGFGFGFKDETVEFHNGVIFSNDSYYEIYSSWNYKNGRHSIYNVDIVYNEEKSYGKVGYTKLFTESFGLKIEQTIGKGEFFIGFRKWF